MNMIPKISSFDAAASPAMAWRATTSAANKLALKITLLGGALFLLALYRHRAFLHDDSMISLRFARNLVEHGVLEWNLGERIEGYTNFLHLIMTAALMKLGIDPIVSVRAINVVSVVGLIWMSWHALRTVLPDPEDAPVRATGLMLVLAAPSVPLWMLGGLETVMVAALLTAGIAYLLPALLEKPTAPARPILAGLLFSAAILTRPDAVLAAGMFLAMILLWDLRQWRQRIWVPLIAGIAMTLPVLVHVAWRFYYYGDLVPNTFHAKVGVPLSLRVINAYHYLAAHLTFVPALMGSLMILSVLRLTRSPPRLAWVLLVPVLVHVAYIVWAGGDHMAGARLLLPIVGFVAVLAAVLTKAITPENRLRCIKSLVAAAAFANLLLPGQDTDLAAYMGRIVGEHLDRTEKPGTVVALATAGSPPYHAEKLRYIDTLGLVDRTIALRREFPLLTDIQRDLPGHAKGDGEYVLSRKPDIIILGGADGNDALSTIHFLSDREMVHLPEFERCYRKVIEFIPYDPTTRWVRTDVENPMVFTYFRRTCEK